MSGRILLVDDDQLVLESHARVLSAAGFAVEGVNDGEEAVVRVDQGFDCILSDIHMPGMDGLTLLKRVRERDLDVPVILVTGEPSLETAMRAIQFGALRYLPKPVAAAELADAVREAVRLRKLARLKREALELTSSFAGRAGDRAGMEATFARALASLWPAFQPIVFARERKVLAYEALLRSAEPALPDPGAVIETAERLGQIHLLGRTVRARIAGHIPATPGDAAIFVNLHPEDLQDADLWDGNSPLVRHAARVVLEITERAPLDHIGDVRDRIARLRELGFRLAVDDFGAGYAGLTSFAAIEPDFVKIDMALVQGIDSNPVKHRVVSRMTELAHDLGMQVIAEGIEKPGERDALVEIGCDFLQGFLLAMPGRPFPDVNW